MKRSTGLLLALLGLVAIVAGCSRPVARCTAPEDNPKHHYLRGMELFEDGRPEEASSKFDRALYCDERYGPAHGGMAMVSAERAKSGEEGYRRVDVGRAFDHLKLSWKYADTEEDEFAYHLASMRVYTALKTKGWLGETEDGFKDAMKLKVDERSLIYYDGKEAAPYFMGVAYLEAREFQKARDRFGEVLNMKRDSRWHEPADRGWKRVDKIVRAMAGITLGGVGKEIALRESVSRGDMAALLIDELKIDKLFAGRIPVKSEIEKVRAGFIPADILDYKFKEEKLAMMKWGVRGLEPVYDETTQAYLFKPEDVLTRKEFALVLEDVLVKLTGDEAIYKAYFGQERSPFPDVPATVSWYNAVMNVVTRNLMEAELSGEFRPDEPVDGADSILAIRVLKQRINTY